MASKRRRWVRWLLIGGAVLVVGLGALGWTAASLPAVGARAQGDRLARMQKSPQWGGDHFNDVLPRIEPELWETMKRWLGDSNAYRKPSKPVPVVKRGRADFASAPESGLRITWLGHSTLLVEIDGARILIDPVWGQYVAPFAYEDARRFYPPPLPFEALPELDAVVISHDHYDHLDHPTVLRFVELQTPFYVPLGVGAHLEAWGIDAARIHEFDWWDAGKVAGIELVATPARHFSGRSLLMTDRDCTLWAGWAILGPRHRVYYSGDTAMFPGFKDIGERYGPFDATLMEAGAYNQMWADVHLGPEQAIDAHRLLKGNLLIPVHWGLFDLALHSWTEPIERILVAANKQGIAVAAPRPGESLEPSAPAPVEPWWPKLPWETAQQAPVVSSGL